MGAGIATVSVERGYDVILKDMSQIGITRGYNQIAKHMKNSIKKKKYLLYFIIKQKKVFFKL